MLLLSVLCAAAFSLLFGDCLFSLRFKPFQDDFSMTFFQMTDVTHDSGRF